MIAVERHQREHSHHVGLAHDPFSERALGLNDAVAITGKALHDARDPPRREAWLRMTTMLFFVRVRLDSEVPNRPSYSELHTQMAAAGFVRYIICRDGEVRKLSSGTYLKQSSLELATEHGNAERAARIWHAESEVTTARATDLRTSGLRKVPEATAFIFKQKYSGIKET